MGKMLAKNISDAPVIVDYGSGSEDRMRTYWLECDRHDTVRWVVSSRRNIVKHILLEDNSNTCPPCRVIGVDEFCVPQERNFILDNWSMLAAKETSEVPDVLMTFNPPPGILANEGGNYFWLNYSGFLGWFLEHASRMKKDGRIFIQIDRAFVEDFPDTNTWSNDNQKFWQLLLTDLSKMWFIISHNNCLLGLTLDRYGPLESKMLLKIK